MRWFCIGTVLCGTAMGQTPQIPELLTPVTPACISSGFGPRPAIGLRRASHHSGIDLRAPAGTPVRAIAAGRVVFVRRVAGYGLVVEIDHGSFRSRTAHLGRVTPALAEGRRMVARGEQIGVAGRSGITYGSHVHLEIRFPNQIADPESFFGNLGNCPS